MTIIEFLLKIIEDGNEITIIYHGGSKPGTTRKIIPRSAEGDTLKAVDTAYNRVKSFSISKIEILNDENEKITFDIQNIEQIEKATITIENLFDTHKEELENLGWQVLFEDGYNEKGSYLKYICLYDSYKNGNIKPNPSVFVYSSTSKHRPFAVGSVRMETRTFKNINNAFKLFLEEAKNCEIKTRTKNKQTY